MNVASVYLKNLVKENKIHPHLYIMNSSKWLGFFFKNPEPRQYKIGNPSFIIFVIIIFQWTMSESLVDIA
jgi:hypothetical protein